MNKTGVEDWHKCVFYFNNKAQGEQIVNRLKIIGFDHVPIDNKDVYVRTYISGTGLARDETRNGWWDTLRNPREFEYEEAIAALTNNPMKKRPKIDLAQLSNVYFKIPDLKIQRKLLDKLFELGYKHFGEDHFETTTLYEYWIITNDKSISGDNCTRKYLGDFMDYNLLFETKSSNNKTIRSNFDNCKIVCKDNQTTVAVHNRLRDLGYLWYGIHKTDDDVLRQVSKIIIYIYDDKSLGWHTHDKYNFNAQHYQCLTQIYDVDILNNQLINTNNTSLNTKTNGNKIIVCKPHPRITSGQRPEGRKLSGKTSRTKMSSGHLSYRAISG